MSPPNYDSPTEIKSFLESKGFAMQKHFSQNFMVNPSARRKIADLAELNAGECVWEIGAGLGCMTRELLARGSRVKAFEIDRGFCSSLRDFYESEVASGVLQIIEGDVMKTWQGELEKAHTDAATLKVVGNLPYSIASVFIAQTIRCGVAFSRCVFTVQQEVAHRMAAGVGSKDYSAFSVLCQFAYDVKLSLPLAAGSFWPRPRVSSQAVVLTRKAEIFPCSAEAFSLVVNCLFASRRKTILNNARSLPLGGLPPEDFLASCGVEGTLRAENLDGIDFARIAGEFGKVTSSTTAMRSVKNP